jgi:hypothetical protein
MKFIKLFTLLLVFSITCIALVLYGFSLSPKTGNIPIQAKQVYVMANEPGNFADYRVLFDEPKKEIPETIFFDGAYGNAYKNAAYVIDLESEHLIDKVSFFDVNSKSEIRFYFGSPEKWNLFLKATTHLYRQWHHLDVQVKTRYLLVEFATSEAKISELVLHGRALQAVEPKNKPIASSVNYPKFSNLLGVNGGIWLSGQDMGGVTSIREYHSWYWNDGGEHQDAAYRRHPADLNYQGGAFKFNPDYGGRHTDIGYRTFKQFGLQIHPCLQMSAHHINPGSDGNGKPVKLGLDASNPLNYIEHASYLFQYTARYGRVAVDAARLQLAPNENKVTGLSFVEYVENWNEPDKWWDTRKEYFSPFEFAAMSSADYDGHEGALGNNVGVKNADSDIKLVMGGLAQLNYEYVKTMKLWSEHFRKDKRFPADVLNFHHYCNAGGHKQTIGISPEDDQLKSRLQELVTFRNEFLPGKEIWLSEYGYDTDSLSEQRVPLVGSLGREETQARWLVRSLMAIAASGIDKAHWYMYEDVVSELKSKQKYFTSGLVMDAAYPANEHQHKPYQKKTSWYYFSNLNFILGKYRFEKELLSGENGIFCYVFKKNNERIYALWLGTSADKKLKNYIFPVSLLGKQVKLYELQKEVKPKEKNLAISGSSLILDELSELPLFIYTNN